MVSLWRPEITAAVENVIDNFLIHFGYSLRPIERSFFCTYLNVVQLSLLLLLKG